jgi:N-acetylglucosamine-6-phosphate deacetylase
MDLLECSLVKLGVEAAVIRGALVRGDVEVIDGRIARYGIAGPGGRWLAAPGFVDLQVNGFGGVDFLRAGAGEYARAGEALLETGVTSYLPTLTTAPEAHIVGALGEIPSSPSGPRILGAHLEGPFIAPNRLGAHPGPHRRDPDVALLERLLDAGSVRLTTLAPELPGAQELIRVLLARGVTVSCGHTDATADEANTAFDLGVRTVTHLFNAMRPFHHRDPGIAGAALARKDVLVQIIHDGVHLSPETVHLVWKAARGRTALVTDAIAAAGTRGNASRLGGTSIAVEDGVARGPTGVLAGSVGTMVEAVRGLHALGAPLLEAIGAATSVPASVLALRSLGRLEVGGPADVVVLDDNLEVRAVLVGGRAF